MTPKSIKALASSKKFLATLAGVVGVIFADPEQSKLIVQLVMAYVVGQGMADFGKEKK